MKNSKEQTGASAFSRRTFVAGASLAALGGMTSKAALGSNANSKIRLGVIGCGGRGTWITNLFKQHGGYELTAAADYFPESVERYSERFALPKENGFTGLSGYRKLLDAKLVDAIAVETPPYFHPEHSAAGVEAGVHVYLAKPIAVDASGCQTVLESGRKATERKQCFLVDFQTRANGLYQEAIRRVHAEDIGKYAFGEASYHAGCPWEDQFKYLEDDPNHPENRLRAWGLLKTFSGDIITEQNIHTLDVASWIMDQLPLGAMGTCSRKVRSDGGDCNDNFTVVYEYPHNVSVSFSSRQFEGFDSQGGIRNRMFGTSGVIETEYGGAVLIRGNKAFSGGNTGNIFTDGVVENIKTFHESIVKGDCSNPTVSPSVNSNRLTILGRMAAYKREKVTWEEMMQCNEKWEADLKGLKA